MKVLYLYNNECAYDLLLWLRDQGNDVVACQERLEEQWCRERAFDLTVCYTYRYILTDEILSALGNNVVNLHNSYLPWNRGADPNIWSIVDGTPRGVTLHYVNTGLDKGDIIAQALVGLEDTGTLKSSYDDLDRAAKQLFKEAFRHYGFWPEMRKRPLGIGSYHSVKDGAQIKSGIISYDMKVSDFHRGGVTHLNSLLDEVAA